MRIESLYLKTAADLLSKGAEKVLLACTDLQFTIKKETAKINY